MVSSIDWKIVIIDDEEDIRKILTLALWDSGYDVVTASDGMTGLLLCSEISPQIVITDVRMPGMNGLEVLKALKRERPDTEVIVATAFGEMDVAIKALQLDASDLIIKPVSDEALHLALTRAKDRFTCRKQLKDYTALLEKEKVQTSQELVKRISFQKNLIESSMDGILGCDISDTVVIYNHSMQQMVGFSKNEVLHKMTFDQFFSGQAAARLKETLAGDSYGGENRLILYEAALLNKSGGEVPVQVSAITLVDDGHTDGLVCFFRDLRV